MSAALLRTLERGLEQADELANGDGVIAAYAYAYGYLAATVREAITEVKAGMDAGRVTCVTCGVSTGELSVSVLCAESFEAAHGVTYPDHEVSWDEVVR